MQRKTRSELGKNIEKEEGVSQGRKTESEREKWDNSNVKSSQRNATFVALDTTNRVEVFEHQ